MRIRDWSSDVCSSDLATVVVSRPDTAVWEPVGPGCGMRPWLGFIPTRPLNPAGMRGDPPPSLAAPHGMSPAAIAAAVPPDDPPGARLGPHGLPVPPHARVLAKLRIPHSGAAGLTTGPPPPAPHPAPGP